MLDSPDDPEDLWLATDGVAVARPLMQGDVVAGLPIGPDGEDAPGIILTHACSMRAGKKLRPRQTVAQIVHQPIALHQWSEQYFDFMPLPDIELDNVGDGCAADFRLISAVPTGILVAADRQAALGEIGIHHLQQRMAHHLTRVVVDLATLAEQSAPVLLEIELQEDWVSESLAVRPDGTDQVQVQEQAEAEFQDLLEREDRRLRSMLREPHSRAQAAREVRLAMRERKESS